MEDRERERMRMRESERQRARGKGGGDVLTKYRDKKKNIRDTFLHSAVCWRVCLLSHDFNIILLSYLIDINTQNMCI